MGSLSLLTHSFFLPIYRATTAFAIPKGASSPKKSDGQGFCFIPSRLDPRLGTVGRQAMYHRLQPVFIRAKRDAFVDLVSFIHNFGQG